jgi:hypothetical protein
MTRQKLSKRVRNDNMTVQKESPNLKDPSTVHPGRHTEQPLLRTIKLRTGRIVDVVDSTRIGIERLD